MPGIAAAVMALLVGTATPNLMASSAARVTIAQAFVGTDAVPLRVAHEFGLFSRHGLDVQVVVTSSTQGMQALLAGEVQLFFGSPSQGLAVAAAGTPIKSIATLGPVLPYVVVGSPKLNGVADLRGKRVGVSDPGLGAARVAALLGLKRLGIDPRRDLTLVVAGSQPNRVQAVANGAIDATLVELVYLPVAQRLGLKMLADLSELGIPWDQDVVLVTARYLQANASTVEAVMRALVEANAFAKDPANRSQVLPVVARTVGTSTPEDTERAYEMLRTRFITERPYPSRQAMQTLVAELSADFPELARVDLNSFVEPGVVRRLEETGFIEKVFGR